MDHKTLRLTDTSWSKLLTTPQSDLVRQFMNHPYLYYHNFDHVERIYRHAQRMNVPYSPELDLAILWHDAVYDHKPDRELRSAELLKKTATENPQWFQDIDISQAASMIINTIEHQINPNVNPWMVRLDLAELAYDTMTRENFWNILTENVKLYNIDSITACNRTCEFMSKHLLVSVDHNIQHDHHEYTNFWHSVKHGCNLTMNMAKTVIEYEGIRHDLFS